MLRQIQIMKLLYMITLQIAKDIKMSKLNKSFKIIAYLNKTITKC